MSLAKDLPIYKVAYDLLDVITTLAANMPRDFKQSIGGKLRDECVEIVVLIFRANCAQEKAPHLETLIERLQVAELLLRLSRDKRLISTGQYAKAVELTTSVGKQAGGWRRSAHRPLHEGQGRHD
jgi:hypothetical protein